MPEFYHARGAPPQGDFPRVFIATPVINFHANHVASLMKAVPRVMGMGISIDHFILANGCHVDDMRNICVKKFLDSDADHLLFIDADVGFWPETLYRMCTHEGDIVAGVYPRKEFARSYPMDIEGEHVSAGPDGLIRDGVRSVPAGFLRISRKVLQQMAEIRLDRTFRSSEAGEAVPIIFERGLKNGNRLSGDVAFCHWARELGYSIHVDVMAQFTHAGEVNFPGCLANDFGAPAEQPKEHVNGQ